MNPLDLSPAEFQDFLTEERQYRSPEQIDDLIRRYNAANSLSGRLAGLLEPQEGRRRTNILPASVPVGMSLMEALQSGEAEFAIPQGIVDMVTGTVRGVENPTLAAQGRIPASDMNASGLETAAAAMGLGGLLATKPAGSVGSNALFSRKPNNIMDEFNPETYYHGTRSDIDAFDENLVDLGVHVGTKGQANERIQDLVKRDDPVYTNYFDSFANIEGQKPKSPFRTGDGPMEGAQILPLKVRANYPLRMPDVGEWDRSEVVMYYIEKMLGEDGDPRLREAFEDFDFDGLDDIRDQFYDKDEWKVSLENREFLDDIRERIKDAGYDSIVYRNAVESSRDEGIQDSMIVLDPRNLRSVNAEFNPDYEFSQDLLAANASKSGGLLSTAAQASLEGFDDYLSRVNPSNTRIAAEDRPNLMMGDMYGMLPRGSDIIGEKGDVTFYRSPDGDYYATAYNPDVGEQDVVGYIMGRGDSTELQVVSEMQGQGIGGELQYLFRSENPDAPTGGLTEAGERSLERTYDRLFDAGLVSANASKTSGFMGQLLNADDIPAKTESQKVAKRILQLRSQGRANEVTEEMMEDADPRTLAAYTPLDMSTKARMERARELGFKPEERSIHGAMDNPERFTFESDITPVYTSDNPAVSNTYTAGEDSAMFDLLVKQGASDNISDQINNLRQKALDVDAQGASYAAISPDFKDKASGNTLQNFFDVYLYPENRGESVQHMVDGETVVGPVTSTDQIAYAMRDEGVPHARIENVLDRGPYSPRAHPIGGFGNRSFDEYKEMDAANRAWERTMQAETRKPSTDQITYDEGGRLRSRFARFDPEFSHLKNLTAANASPLVGLLTQGLSEKQANKIEDYLYRTGLLQ